MSFVADRTSSIRTALPADPWACWASIFFSGCVLTLLISVAATQSFLALASLLYFVHLLRKTPTIRFPPIKLPLALFCGWTVVSMIFAAMPAVSGFAIRKLTLFLIILLAVNLIVTARHLIFLLMGVFVEAAAAGAVAIVQFVEQYRRVRVEHPHRIYALMTRTRIHGFMGHWMNFGGQQMLVFCLLLAFLLWVRKSAIENPKWIAWLLMALLAASILLNFTRSVWLGCFAALVYLVARWRARWLLLLPVLVVLPLIAGPRLVRHREESLFFHPHDRSIAERFEMWHAGWRMICKHPLAGVGPDNIPEVYDLYLPRGVTPMIGYHSHLHNDYIQFAAERGIPCLAAWLWLMGALGWAVLRFERRFAALRWIAHGAFAAWLALLLEGFFEFNFGSTPVLMVFLFVISVPFAAERVERGGV
jgi:O-antigen ligase